MSRHPGLCSIEATTPAYSVARSAHYANLPPATLASWVFGRHYTTRRGKAVAPPIIDVADPASRLLSFVNVVEVYVLAVVRRVNRIPMRKVREAVEHLRERMGVERPLIDIPLKTDGVDIFVDWLGGLYQASDRERPAIAGLVAEQLERIDLLIPRLHPFSKRKNHEREHMVSISPKVQFGRLVITDTRVPTAVVASRFLAGEQIEDLASDYEIEPAKIEEAIRWEVPSLKSDRAA